jgi:hypothetical protein
VDGLWKARMGSVLLFFSASKADFCVETVEFDICDMVVENFAESGKKRRFFLLETVVHSL